MKFNDSSDKPSSLYHDALFWIFGTRTASTSQYDISDFTASANYALDKLIALIFRSQQHWSFDDTNNTDLPRATFAIVSGQTNYALPDAHLRVLALRIKDTSGIWHTLDPKDKRELSDAELALSGIPSAYYQMGRSVFPLPVPNFSQAASGEVTYQRGSNYFTDADTTKEPGVDDLWHRYISLCAAKDHLTVYGPESRMLAVQKELADMSAEITAFYSARSADERPQMTAASTDCE